MAKKQKKADAFIEHLKNNYSSLTYDEIIDKPLFQASYEHSRMYIIERNSVVYNEQQQIIDNIRDDSYKFSDIDETNIYIFLKNIGKLTNVDNWINNINNDIKGISNQKLNTWDLLNEFKNAKSTKEIDKSLIQRKCRNHAVYCELFSIVKYFQNTGHYPLFFPHWRDMCQYIFEINNYDELCQFYRKLPHSNEDYPDIEMHTFIRYIDLNLLQEFSNDTSYKATAKGLLKHLEFNDYPLAYDNINDSLKETDDIKNIDKKDGTSQDKMIFDQTDDSSGSSSSDAKKKLPLNLILYGPPGTGKTHHTVDRALDRLLSKQELKDLTDGKTDKKQREALEKKFDELRRLKRIEFITFHQSMSYEDFIEGIKPITKGRNVIYKVLPGIFKRICERAEQDSGNNYVLIIDEINRGNVASIFGELITLIEDNKREKLKVKLPYSNKCDFTVPKNLYIIGTMNTADRSVEALDTALRRRFSFEEMMPNSELLQDYTIKTNGFEHCTFSDLLDTINKRVEVLKDRDHLIGHSYFMIKDAEGKDIKELNLSVSDESKILKNIFFDKIIPLLQEYFYGDYEKILLVLGDGFFEQLMKTTDVTFAVKNPDIPEGIIYQILSKDKVDMAKALKLMSIQSWKEQSNTTAPQQPTLIQTSEAKTLINES